MNRRQPQKSGYILLVVLACLCTVLALTLSALQTALRMRREVRMQHLVSQATVLCEAGLSRAASKLQHSSYEGETWSPSVPELPSKQAMVTISLVERSPSKTTVQIEAVIEDPNNNHNRVQRTLTATLTSESISESSLGESP